MNNTILELRHISKHYPVKSGFRKNAVVRAVNDVSFTIQTGETLGLVGESGCGKSTLGNLIMQLEEPTSGQIFFNGSEISKKNIKDNYKNLQIIFQDPYSSLDPRKTIGSIVEEPLIVQKTVKDKHERYKMVKDLLAKVGINSEQMNRYPGEFSGGQRQRIAIARAIILNPKFIICDEPVSALDVSIQAQIMNLMIKLQKELGLTYLFISHDLSVVRHISDRIVVMYMGNIMEMADTDTIFGKPLHPYTQALLSAIPEAKPETSRKRQRILLNGEMPSPMKLPSGCVFCSRCPKATDICKKEKPNYSQIEPGHFCACHLCSNDTIAGT